MREYPEPNYILSIAEILNEEDPAVAGFLRGGWVVSVNYIVIVKFLPYFPRTPWPPPPADDLSVANNEDEAARVVFSTTTQLVTPTDGPERIEEFTGEIPSRQTIYWISTTRYAEIESEFRALRERPDAGDNRYRLYDLADGALRRFLTADLPRSAALSDNSREILCLPELSGLQPPQD